MKLIQKWKVKRKINKAIENAVTPIWFVNYFIETDENEVTGTFQIPANSEGIAMTKASKMLNEMSHGKVWSITSVSCL